MKIYYLNTKILDILVDDTSVRYRSIMQDNNLTLNFSTVEPVTVLVGSYCEFEGDRVRIEEVEGDEIIIHDFEIKKSKYKKDNAQDSEFSYTLVGANY